MQVHATLEQWAKRVTEGSVDDVLELYHPQSVLLSTLSNTIRLDIEGRRDYFEFFLAQRVFGSYTEYNEQQLAGGSTICAGKYTFTAREGNADTAFARFTYVIDKDGLIIHHHSSLLPE